MDHHSTEVAPVKQAGVSANAKRNAEWIALYTSGLSVDRIAYMKGVPRGRVNNVICRYGKPRPSRKHGRDLTGQRFGLLVVHTLVGRIRGSREYYWGCKCDCGGFITTRRSCLVDQMTKSCGCLPRGRKKKAA